MNEPRARRPSQISLTTLELRDTELPPLPDPLPDPTPVTPEAGIPLPISTSRPHQERPERPQTPSAPICTLIVFVVQALESILSAKETERRKPLADSVQRALGAITPAAPELPPDPAVVFEPLQVACSVRIAQLTAAALDCIWKLISYSYFSVSAAPLQVPTPPAPLNPRRIYMQAGEQNHRPQSLQYR